MTMFMRNNLATQVIAEVQTHFGDVIFKTVIPRTVRLAEAPSHGKPILEYEPNGLGSTAYKALAERVPHAPSIPPPVGSLDVSSQPSAEFDSLSIPPTEGQEQHAMPSPHAQHWSLSPDVIFLNHGSFGACPRAVLDAQTRAARPHGARSPSASCSATSSRSSTAAREQLAAFLGADPRNLVFIANATAGVNAVLRSLALPARRRNPHHRPRLQRLPQRPPRHRPPHRRDASSSRRSPSRSPTSSKSSTPFSRSVTARTRLAFIDHITSPTALVFPIGKIVRLLEERGVDTSSMVPTRPAASRSISIRSAPPTTPAICTNGSAPRKAQPSSTSAPTARSPSAPPSSRHGENIRRPGRSHFHDRFDWPGTFDPTAWLTVPDAHPLRRQLFSPAVGPSFMIKTARSPPPVAPSSPGGSASLCPRPIPCSPRMATIPLPETFQRVPFNVRTHRPAPDPSPRRAQHRDSDRPLGRPRPPLRPPFRPSLQQHRRLPRPRRRPPPVQLMHRVTPPPDATLSPAARRLPAGPARSDPCGAGDRG